MINIYIDLCFLLSFRAKLIPSHTLFTSFCYSNFLFEVLASILKFVLISRVTKRQNYMLL